MAKSTVALTFEMSSDQIAEIVANSPELQAGVIAAFQAGLPKSRGTKAAGATRSPSGRVRRGAHHEMAIKALAAAGARSAEKGVYSRDVKAKGVELGHSFGSTLNATLDALIEKGIVQYKDVAKKGAGKKRYLFWLESTEKAALEALSTNSNDDSAN